MQKNNDKKKTIKIVTIAVSIVIVMYLLVIFVNLLRKPTKTCVVENGKIYKEEYAEGYIIRDEKMISINAEEKGIVPIKGEGEKVAKGEQVIRYCVNNEEEINDKIKNIDIEIQNNLASGDVYYSSDIKIINNQIEKKLDEIYQSNDLQNVTKKKTEINDFLTKKIKIRAENSDNENLKKLINQRNALEKELKENSKYIKAEESGVISYKVDGLEDKLKNDDFSYLNEKFLDSLNIKTGQIIAASQKNGKIVENFKCNVCCVLESEEAKNSEVGKKIKLRLQNSEEVPAKIVYKNQEGNKTLLVFEINECVTELIQYRKTSFDVIWWSDSGMKVLNTVVKNDEKASYVIRDRAGLKEKIYVKVLRTNEKYSIVENYTYEELSKAGIKDQNTAGRKTLSAFDQVEM